MGLHAEIDSGADLSLEDQEAAVEAFQDLAKSLSSLGLSFTGHVHTNAIKQALGPVASVSVDPGTGVSVGGGAKAASATPTNTKPK